MALTLSDVRARVETDLDDATVQRILDAAVEDVNRHAGDVASQTETFRAWGAPEISLRRRALDITEVTEIAHRHSDPVVLSPNDFRRSGDYRLARSLNGDNPASCWGFEVVVDYVPEVDPELRDRVTLDLIQIDVEFRALESEGVGDWDGSYGDYEERRKAVLAQVREGRSPLL